MVVQRGQPELGVLGLADTEPRSAWAGGSNEHTAWAPRTPAGPAERCLCVVAGGAGVAASTLRGYLDMLRTTEPPRNFIQFGNP